MTKVEKNPDNIKRCLCRNCPTYNECMKEKQELLFCASEVGKSSCAPKMRGCICPVCPVHKANGLRASFFCIHGSADKIE